MFKFFIDVFCKDTIIGLSGFNDIRTNRIYKNNCKTLFSANKHRQKKNFIDPIVCRL